MLNLDRFPRLEPQKEDRNPAIQLYGRRFYKDQTEIEYLVEFLLVFVSRKKVFIEEESKGKGTEWPKGFPNGEALRRFTK
jgi:hypothetical protein